MARIVKTLYTFFILRHAGLFLFLVACLVGVFSFQEYGLAWDENAQWQLGSFTWNYVFNHDPYLFSIGEADHGVCFELFLVLAEKILGLQDTREIFLMRHLVCHLFFLAGALYCYKLVELLYQNKWLAAISFLFFVLHPHIYAHSFFNSKDAPFLALLMICFYHLVKLLQKKTLLNAIVLGLCLGLLINMRQMGVLLLGCTLFLLCLEALQERRITLHLKLIALILVFSLLMIYITWPYLWKDPVAHFIANFRSMSRFSWPMENLFRGKLVMASDITWEYIPLWFCITTPVPYLLAGFSGLAVSISLLIRRPLKSFSTLTGKMNLVALICFILPVLTVILLGSVLYDGWRHLFFIYPSFVLLMIAGIHVLVSRYKKAVLISSFLVFLYTGSVMFIDAPFQHIYFNSLVGRRSEPEYLRKNYDLDYWGTAYRRSLEHILANDNSQLIKIYVETDPGHYNLKLLPVRDRERIAVVPLEEATYFLTNYRWHPQDYPFENKKIYSVKVRNNTINAVYKLK